MAMVVKNNMAAVRTLNILNGNSSALNKSLSRVSSGMKITGAQDDAAGYAISERMRVRIRALDQANQNSQNDSSLMKTAEGAVGNTIDILKALKEKAINSANDSNTDEDRQTIQKEIDQFIDQIDDNALVTFNGKYLVDGSKNNAVIDTKTVLLNQSLKKGTLASDALTSLDNRAGDSLGIQSSDKWTVSFVQNGEIHTTSGEVGSNSLADILKEANVPGAAAATTEDGLIGGAEPAAADPLDGYTSTNMTAVSSGDVTDLGALQAMFTDVGDITALSNITDMSGISEITDYFMQVNTDTHELDSTAQPTQVTIKFETHAEDYVDGQAVSPTVKVSFFDSSGEEIKDVSEATLYKQDETNYTDEYISAFSGTADGSAVNSTVFPAEISDTFTPFTGGGAGGTAFSEFNNIFTDESGAYGKLYQQTTFTDGSTGYAEIDPHAGIRLHNTASHYAILQNAADKDSSALGTVYQKNENYKPEEEVVDTSVKDKFNRSLYTPDRTYGVAFIAGTGGVDDQVAGLTISISDQDGNVKKAANAALDQFKQYQRAENATGNMSLTFHIGSEANQAIQVGLSDMRAQALGLKGTDGQKVNVYTKENANAAINAIENALTKALDQQTTIGAIEARLEYTSTNLTTSSENVQAAESTIRDADMAKEMTNYTKANVLLQAAQAMLAQANQSSSGVLSLLQ